MPQDLYIQFGVGALVFLTVVCIGGAFMASRFGQRKAIEERLRPTVGGTTTQPPSETGQPRFYKALHGIGTAVAPKGTSKGLAQELAPAGIYGRSAPFVFMGIKIVCCAAALIAALIFVRPI